MSSKAAITVNRPRDEVERLWRDPDYRSQWIDEHAANVEFKDAPGDRGTEIHVEVPGPGLPLPLVAGAPLAKAKDELRRFKQHAETGEVPRSDAVPEGELAERKLKQRPAQPLEARELEAVGVR